MRLQRVFIALAVPQPVAEQLAAQIAPHLSPDSTAVAPENVHLTLAFLGKLPEAMLQPLSDNLQTLAGCLPQTIQLDAIASFPNPQGKILAAWVEPSPSLISLFREVKSLLAALQLNADFHDHFLPHITLARLNAGDAINCQGLAGSTQRFTATTLGIYQGSTTAQGYRYQCLWSIERNAGSSSP